MEEGNQIKKKRAINRLQSMYPLRNIVNEAYLKTLEASNAGKPTAWSMVNYWESDAILKAMDIEIIYPENYGTIAASMGAAEKYLEKADEEGFPGYICGYARTTLGYTYQMMVECEGAVPPDAPVGGMAKPSILIGSGALCDARFKWFQSLGRYMDVPQWVLELPHLGVEESQEPEAYQYSIDFIKQELRNFIEYLEKQFQKPMNWDKLEELVHYTLEINLVFHEINELRRARPCPMHSCDFWSSMAACLFLAGNPAETLTLYRNMYDEVTDRVRNKISGINYEEKYRLLFAELPPWHSLKFFDRLAERGWNFVVESYAYHPIQPFETEASTDPLENIARISYSFIHARHKRALHEKIYNVVLQPYLENAVSFSCEGALLHPLLTCRMASFHLKSLKDYLMKRLNIPSLTVEGDIVDIRLFNPQSALIQAEAFEEIMDHYKGVREELQDKNDK
jgi:benzoyl-CoA reductase subunit B